MTQTQKHFRDVTKALIKLTPPTAIGVYERLKKVQFETGRTITKAKLQGKAFEEHMSLVAELIDDDPYRREVTL
jgi:hypothetical protein